MKLIELTKVCTKCGARKNWLKFHKHKKCHFGITAKCKVCLNKQRSVWLHNNPEKTEKAREKSREWKQNNPEEVKKYLQEYKAANAEKVKEWKRRSYKKNFKKISEQNREYAKKHPEQIKATNRRWYKKNFKKAHKRNKEWRQNNPERMRELGRKYREDNREKLQEKEQKYRKNNSEKLREKARIYQRNNKEKASARSKKYRETHREKCRATGRKAMAKILATPKGNLNGRIRKAINRSLRGSKNGKHWENLVGYTVDKLKKHLEKLFTDGMTWEKFLNGEIHIDHKIPINVFNFTRPEHRDFKRCWALKNLQPLWKKDNLQKHAKLENHFQPSLLI